ncbi:signal transduction protein Syg1 [Aspergillus luchuensis]|uniref:Signal transduction protein Syg1 n=1 Tax=Aspergillus kawachii TaxID=1069201 RepID=A0A146F0I5_ASPKA|nr:signal transduction protein Syg1 [Aspergillus luchuensis]
MQDSTRSGKLADYPCVDGGRKGLFWTHRCKVYGKATGASPTWASEVTGKKKVKAISRALQKTSRSPSHPSLQQHNASAHDDQDDRPAGSDGPSPFRRSSSRLDANDPSHIPSTPIRSSGPTPRSPRSGSSRSERQPLRVPGSRFSGVIGSYGSIVPSPPLNAASSDVASLRLPDPAIDPKHNDYSSERDAEQTSVPETPSPVMSRHASTRTATKGIVQRSPATPQKDHKRNATPGPPNRRGSLLQRVLSYPDWDSPEKRGADGSSEFEKRQDEFFAFLDNELTKIESFYQMKEEEAAERLKVLRHQLHIMRDQRTQEVLGAKLARPEKEGMPKSHAFGPLGGLAGFGIRGALTGRHFGKNSKALAELGTPSAALQGQDPDHTVSRRDFIRRPEDPTNSDVSYRSAKRKLKHALQEYYRGVELLKAYAYLNRTAFRKINKKYDKTTNARPAQRYMSEKVNKSWFVQSEVTENLLSAAEDLYARYFERGNRKIAASKLRHTINKSGDYSPCTFRAGVLLMGGVLFSAQSLVYAVQNLHDRDGELKTHTSYLLQCNSSHSRLLGFFTCLPGIWRALQCLRRYADTRNVFPHLLNFGKYTFTILYYVTLSLYRIDKAERFQATFITFALLNAVYVSVWDLVMDWSLGNAYAKRPLLRDVLAFRQAWVYYVAMVIDVIVRFNWIFYAIFTRDMQHSALLSFFVALSEVCRRGIWTIFRVENEHCTNVLLFRASRDVPLPYQVSLPPAQVDQQADGVPLEEQQPQAHDVEHGTPSTPGMSVRNRGLSRVGSLLASAHAQDFQRKKRPGQDPGDQPLRGSEDTPDDSTDDEYHDGRASLDDDVIMEELPFHEERN